MLVRPLSGVALLGPLAISVCVAACAARAGTVPMAGHRNGSTTCVFGLRGVRVALEDEAPNSIDVRLTMCSDLVRLRQRARSFLAKQGTPKSAADSERGVREIELGHERASAHVEDVSGGVRIVVVPDASSSVDAVRDEIETRIARLSSDDRCD